MLTGNKGIYPNWVNKSDIINQVLKEMVREGGRLPYSYVINANHEDIIQERMKKLLVQMEEEKLIQHPLPGGEFLEIDLEGSRAVIVGYKKYKRVKRWDNIVQKLTRVSIIFFFLAVLGLIVGLLYFILHFFKVL